MASKAQIVGSVVAGFPSPAEQYVEPPLDINAYLIKRKEATFLMHVDGDSMKNAAILDNDVIVVDRSLRPASGDIIVASVEDDLMSYGKALRKKIHDWVGIPCGVGFAKTKTLAKIANHIGKKQPGGVFIMPDDPTEILAKLPTNEVWGVGQERLGLISIR